MTSGKSFVAKQCGECSEKMPVTETFCYCGGPVTVVRLPLEEKPLASHYHGRKWLAARRKDARDRPARPNDS